MAARRTIHDMNKFMVRDDMYLATKGQPSFLRLDICADVARRLAGPDPRPIVEALRNLIIAGSFVVINHKTGALVGIDNFNESAEKARAALDVWEKGVSGDGK